LEAFVTGLRIEDDSGAFAAQVATDRHAMLVENVANQRDRNAFQELFSFFAPRLKSFALRLGCDAALAEEIAQDVMVTVWSKAHLYDRLQSSVSTWVFRIARNRRIDHLRRAAQVTLDINDPGFIEPASPDLDPVDAISGAERDARVRAALAELPAEQLELLKLAFYEGLSHRDIANRLDLALGTVKSRIRLAFQKMRNKVTAEDI